MEFKTLSNTQSIALQSNKLVIKTTEAEAHITIYSPSIIRVNVTRQPNNTDASFAVIQQPLTSLQYEETDAEVTVKTSALTLRISKAPLRFAFYTPEGKMLSRDDERFGINWQNSQVINYRELQPDEKFIGLGEKVGNLNRRASSFVNWNTDA